MIDDDLGDGDFRELLEAARDALLELCLAIDPATGRNCRLAYRDIKQALEARDSENDEPEPELRRPSKQERKRILLDMLAIEPLTSAELTARCKADGLDVYRTYLDADLRELRREGLVEASKDRRLSEGAIRAMRDVNVYRLTGNLTGPIVDLERQFHEAGD